MTEQRDHRNANIKKNGKWWEQCTPHYYPFAYLKLAEERGFATKELLKKAGLSEEILTRPERSISFAELSCIVAVVIEAIGIESIGLEVGWRLPPTAFGNVGYALLCSKTLREALHTLKRFWHLVATGIFLHIEESNNRVEVQLTLHDSTPDIYRPVVIECSLTSFYRGIQIMQPNALDQCEIWFATPKPFYSERVIEKLGNVNFGMSINKIIMPVSSMDLSLEMYNPTGLKFAIEQCEREESLSGLSSDGLKPKVEKELTPGANGYGYPRFEDICERLHMTERTLRRKLQSEGCKYQTLLEDARRRDSVLFLDRNNLEIQQIAQLLGYDNPANFTRAFRKWTGQTPSQYREARNRR